MATTHENPIMGSHGKPPKSGSTRRKISLPWFRQASIGEKLTRLRLPRQNTVDCPPSATRSSSSAERFNNIRRKVMSGSSSVEVDHLPYMCPISTLQFQGYRVLFRVDSLFERISMCFKVLSDSQSRFLYCNPFKFEYTNIYQS